MLNVDQGRPGGNFTVRARERTRERLREEVLAVAAAEVLAQGWRGLRMQSIAEVVGVSRQTLYNEFADKHGLAQALVFDIAATYLREQEQLVERSVDVRSALRDTVCRTLELFAENELFKTVISADGSDTFLPLYTREGAPLINLVCARMTTAFARRWPSLDPERLHVGLEAMTRLVVSHIVLPLYPPAQVAENAASIFTGYLTGASQ